MKKSTEKIVLVWGSIAVALAWIIARAKYASAKTPPKGEVYIDEVTVTPATWDAREGSEDTENLKLASLQRAAMTELDVDLDEMVPRRFPSPAGRTIVAEAIYRLRTAGRLGDADFLQTMLDESRELEGVT